MTEVIPDAEVVVVAWAKANTPLLALIGGRVATRIPTENTEQVIASGFLRVRRIGGGRSETEAPLDTALMQVDAYASRKNGQPDYAKASQIARTFVAAAEAVRGVALASGHIYGFSRFSGPRDVDEPETGWARFQTDCYVTFRRAD